MRHSWMFSAALVLLAGGALADSPTVGISKVTVNIYQKANPSDNFWDTASTATPAFSVKMPTIAFNATDPYVTCSNSTGVTVATIPMVNVIPQSDGTCVPTTLQSSDGTMQAGVGNLASFDSSTLGYFVVSGPGQVEFGVSADDGFALGIGSSNLGNQPTYVSGVMIGAPAASIFKSYPIMGASFVAEGPTLQTFIVDFPAKGIYPFEMDYFECCGGALTLTLMVNQILPVHGTKQ